MEAEFNFKVELETLIHKISVDPKLLQLTILKQNNQKERASEELSRVFTEPTERLGWLFAFHGRPNCNDRREKEISGKCTTFRTPQFDENAGRE